MPLLLRARADRAARPLKRSSGGDAILLLLREGCQVREAREEVHVGRCDAVVVEIEGCQGRAGLKEIGRQGGEAVVAESEL